MLRRASIAFLLLLCPSLGQARPPVGPFKASSEFVEAPWAGDLDREVKSIKRRFSGTMNVYVSDPYRGYRYGYRDDVPVYLASVVKTTFMIGVYRLREAGELNFEDQIEYTEARVRDGAPRVNKHRVGEKLKVSLLLDYMMRSSDNAASDMLAERVGLERVQNGLLEEGLDGFTPLTYLVDVRRGIYRNLDVTADDLTPLDVRTIRWTPIWEPQVRRLNEMLGRPRGTYSRSDLLRAYDAFYATGVNRAPMRTLGLMYEKMVRSELVSKKASEDMMTLMSNARTSTHRLLGRLPRGTKVMHKTGSQFNRMCDTGIILLPDGRPLIVSACMQNGPVPTSERNIARIARKAYDLAVRDHQKE